MKIKKIQITFVAIIALSIFSSMFIGDVAGVDAQSSNVWSAPINLSNSGASSNPVLVVDTLGVMHAFWIDQFDGYRYSESVDGSQWTLPKTAKYPFDPKGAAPLFLAGPKGIVYIFYETVDHTLTFAEAASEKLGDPGAWESRFPLSKQVLAYDFAVDTQGFLHIVYIRNVDSALGPAGVYYMQSQNTGRSWSAEKLLYSSQYFRTTESNGAHVQVSTSSVEGEGKVIVAWDNIALKRIFMASSTDSGLNWSEPVQLKGAEDTGGYNTPYNVYISLAGERTLLTWEVGEPGSSQCILYGQWSADGGATWGEVDALLGNRSMCPQDVDFLVNKDGSIIALMSYLQNNPSLMAWNGSEWSEPQIQNEISYFVNPVTNETIIFGCQSYLISGDNLFIIGCDQGSGGDIWLTSRKLESVSQWSFSTSLWSSPTLLATGVQPTFPLIYTSDDENLNVFWAQSPALDTDSNGVINYAGWDGSQWSPATNIITAASETAGTLSATLNKKRGRLLLVWSSEKDGNLLFSWADVSRVNIPSEWDIPRDIPSPSQWTSSPDILVDALGRIVVVYAVPFNENRGIYLVESIDNGTTWSAPVRVFDAVSSGWDMVDNPKIAVTADGRLHVLFTKYLGSKKYPAGLYYSQSVDGGTTWSDPEVVSDSPVVWSELVSNDGQTIHRLWQVNGKSGVANLHDVSRDGGVSWGISNNITGASDVTMPVTAAVNDTGELHLIQLVTEDSPRYLKEYDLRIKDWRWDGTQWSAQPSQTLKIEGDRAEFSLAAGIASNGFISVSVTTAYYDLKGNFKDEVYNIGRLLNSPTVTETPFLPVIASPVGAIESIQPTIVPTSQSFVGPTLSPILTEKAPSAFARNLVGVFLALIVLGLVVFVFVRRTGSGNRK